MAGRRLDFGVHSLKFLRRNPTAHFPLAATSSAWVDQERPLLVMMPRYLFPVFAHGKIAGCQDLFLIVVYNGDDVAHAWVEFHLPRAFPFSELVKVFLARRPSWSLFLLYRRLSSAKSLALAFVVVLLHRVSHLYTPRSEERLWQYLEVLQIGQLQRTIMYLLVRLAVFCRTRRTVSSSGCYCLLRCIAACASNVGGEPRGKPCRSQAELHLPSSPIIVVCSN